MANLSALILPVLVDDEIEMQTFNLPGGSGGAGSPEGIGIGYGVCNTAYATTAKTAVFEGYNLKKNGVVAIKFANNVNAGATLNINSEGAKPIYYRGQSVVEGIIKAGDIATFIYDGTRYNILTTDNSWRAEVDIYGSANTVVSITNSTYGIADTIALDSDGKGVYICKAPGTYIFDTVE